jgi:hypothetical protein
MKTENQTGDQLDMVDYIKHEDMKGKFRQHLLCKGMAGYKGLKVKEDTVTIIFDRQSIKEILYLYEIGFSCLHLDGHEITLQISVKELSSKLK